MSASKATGRAMAVIMLAAAAAVAFAAQNDKDTGGITNGVSALLAAANTVVQLGDPIKVSLSVRNQGDRETIVEKSATAFDCFDVRDPEGQSAPYVGFMGQVWSNPVAVQPSSTVKVVEALDLTDKYLFQKPGRYSIRFNGGPYEGIPSSNRITVDVTPGQLGELDQIVAQLLLVCPKGWRIMKSSRGEDQAAPFGRARVPGCSAHIYRSFMGGEAVYVWLTKAEAPITSDQQTDRSEYLGQARRFHAYVAPTAKATNVWPKALDDISRALQIPNEQK